MSEQKMREFVGWLSGDIPELHQVEVPRLVESLDRFLALAADPPSPARVVPSGGDSGQLPTIEEVSGLLPAEYCEAVMASICGEANQMTQHDLTQSEGPWRSMESAPTDGTRVLVFCDKGGITVAVPEAQKVQRPPGKKPDGRSRWWLSVPGADPIQPTHWMPLPVPPQEDTP